MAFADRLVTAWYAPRLTPLAAALADELRRSAGQAKDPVIIISADASATHQSVVNVMEAARMAGLVHITFATQSSGGAKK